MPTVRPLYTAMMVLLAKATDRELARMVSYLKEENKVLRGRLPARINVTSQERVRLLRFGRHLGKAVHGVVTIVSPGTFLRWLREDGAKSHQKKPRGRPKTKEKVRDLIVRLGTENDWGYTRIMGELKKLGIAPPSRNTVKRILKAAGLEPGPKRGSGTWDEFLTRHAATLVQCDFLNKRIWTANGLRDVFVLVFLHVGTRRALVSPATTSPTAAWVQEQTKRFLEHARADKLPVKMLFHDNDTKFSKAVDQDLRSRRIKVCKTAFRAPNTNAFVERFIQTLQQECLDHFVVLGQRHFDYLVTEWLEHYHWERPHQAKDNDLLIRRKPRRKKAKRAPPGDDVLQLSEVRCEQRLGGHLKHYYRKAA
jgi:putative transposase